MAAAAVGDVLPAVLGTAAILMVVWAYFSTARATHSLVARAPRETLWKWWIAFGTTAVAVGVGHWLDTYVYPGFDIRNIVQFKVVVYGGTIVIGVTLIAFGLYRRRDRVDRD